jgi:putative aldouronate transport system substrate-binding protein
MSRKTKRLLLLMMAMLMVLSTLSGCGTSNNAASTSQTAAATTTAETSASVETTSSEAAPVNTGVLPISKELITLTAFWPAPANVLKFITDFNEASVWPVLEKQTNVHIKFQHGNAEQFSLMINSGDMADIIFAPDASYIYPGGGDKAIADGAYLKLNDYLDKYGVWYPKLINSTPDFKRDSRTDAGNIWGFAMVETKVQGAWMGMTARQDWLDELGLPTPVTYDDWFNMLTKIKEVKGTASALLLPKELFDWCDSFISGYNVGKGFYQVDQKIKYGPIEPGFKDFITMMAKWYKAGLIDKDFATRDAASMDQLKYTKQAGAWFDGFWVLKFNNGLAEDKDKYRQVGVPNPVQKVGDVAHLRQTNYNIRNEWTSVSAKSKYAVEAVKWLDNLYSDENHLLLNYGVGDESYVKKGDKWEPTELLTKNPDGLNMAEAEFRYVMHDGPMQREISRDDVAWTADELACEPTWNKADTAYVIPMVSLTADEATTNANIMNDVTTYVTETCTKYVMGVEDIGTFDQFVEKIKSMKIDEAIAVQQTALDRYYKR